MTAKTVAYDSHRFHTHRTARALNCMEVPVRFVSLLIYSDFSLNSFLPFVLCSAHNVV